MVTRWFWKVRWLQIMFHTQSIGNVVELQCISKFIEMGFDCSIPYGNACKYDFIADIKGDLLRIQCKASTPMKKNGKRDTEAFTFSCKTQTTNTRGTTCHGYSSQEIDYFATYFQGEVYVIPVEECARSKVLRFSPPNNGRANYNKAEQYLIQNMFGHRQDKCFLDQKKERENIVAPTQRRIFKCLQCGVNNIYTEGGICRECRNYNMRKVERPSREELKSLIKDESFLEVGRKFRVSDKAIRKWCESYHLPSKKSDIKKYSDKEWTNI